MQGCPQQAFGLLIVDVVIKCPTADIDAVHGEITRLMRTLPQYGKFRNLLGIHTPLADNSLWNSPHIGKQQRQDCVRFDLLIALLNRNVFNFDRVDLMDLRKRVGGCFAETCTDAALFTGDDCLVTGQLRCQQGHWAFHKVSKPELFLSPKLWRRKHFRRNNCFLSGIWTESSNSPSHLLQM